ncbi:ABC transporter ATP-binding protein [Paracoccaceae bacterium Fryx2]|nr:ABC transporter ATP-binding protein [Paracoccaceae bacterium Fryx2]
MDRFLGIASVTKTYRPPEGGMVTALDDVTLEIRNNEFLTLLGPSGCGKTTLLKCLAGFEDVDAGDILLEGRSLRALPPYRRPFNTVFQNYALFPHLSVSDNVGYGLDVARVARDARNRRVDEALALVGLSGFGARAPHMLSGGQQQRVALARALVLRPRVLLLDEPLSALNRQMREAMQIELKALQHSVGITFVFVTHDQQEALAMSDRIAVLSQGRVQQLGTPEEVYDRPATTFVASFVGTGNLFAGRVTQRIGPVAGVTTDQGRTLMAEAGPFAPGDRVSLLLRPEHLTLTPFEGAAPALEGRVAQSVFVGSDLHLHVDVGMDRPVIVHHRHQKDAGRPLGVGAAVSLHYAPASGHLIAAGG